MSGPLKNEDGTFIAGNHLRVVKRPVDWTNFDGNPDEVDPDTFAGYYGHTPRETRERWECLDCGFEFESEALMRDAFQDIPCGDRTKGPLTEFFEDALGLDRSED